MEDFLGSGAMPQREWAVKTQSTEFVQDVREMRGAEVKRLDLHT